MVQDFSVSRMDHGATNVCSPNTRSECVKEVFVVLIAALSPLTATKFSRV